MDDQEAWEILNGVTGGTQIAVAMIEYHGDHMSCGLGGWNKEPPMWRFYHDHLMRISGE